MQWYWDIVHWIEEHQAACMYKKYLGIECPGCGMQRAFILLLKGDIAASIHTYPSLIPLLFMFVYLVLHLFFKFKHGARVLLYLFVINSVIIVFFYVYKMLNS